MAATCASGEQGEAGDGGCSAIVERADELEVLAQCFDRARQGSGTAVMVCGSAGTGKTSLVRTFLGSTDHEEPPTVLWGGCDDLIAPRSFGPFRDMVRTTGLLPDELAVDPDLEDLLLNLVTMLDRPSRPAVVVVEDAQWADDASIDVMRYLARRLGSLHAMLIVTTRDEEAVGGQPVRGLLTGSSSSAPVRIDLGPLSPEAVGLLGQDSPLDSRYLYEVSGGNPLLVRQLLSADPADATSLARETLMARAQSLSTEGRAALQAMAVLPDGASPTLARTLFADRPDALHEAETTGLLTSTATHIRFLHELGRTAVMDAMTFGERMAATDNVLAALTASGENPTVLVHIARAAGDGPRATEFALDVLDHGLRVDDHPGAWVLARIALECTVDVPTDRIAWLHSKAAAAGRAISRHGEAMQHAERVVQLLIRAATDGTRTMEMGDDNQVIDRELARAWMTLADLQSDAGDHLRARTGLRNARNLLGGPTTHDWVRCNTRLAAAALVGGEPDRCFQLASTSVEVAESNAWIGELVHALGVRGVAVGGPVVDAGLHDLTRACELGALHGPADHHIMALLALADGHLRMAETEKAEQLVDEAVRFSDEHGLRQLKYRSQVRLAQVLLHRGRTDEAEKLASRLVDEASDPGVIEWGAEATLARVMVRRADEDAAKLVEQAWSEAVATGEIEKLAFAGISRVEHLWVEGDEEALRQFARYLAGLGERHRHHRLRAEALRMLQRLGDEVEISLPAKADGTANADGTASSGQVGDPYPAPLSAALAGDHETAAELWESAGEPISQALELIESSEAANAFEGLRLLDRSGATRIADLTRHRLRGRGLQGVPRGPRKSSVGGVPILTGRQIDVLKHLARGLTNAEIADELYVARRTVDNHVSAILSRLNAKGRTQAVEEALARGLIER